jgi:hypothetical protein
MRHAWVVAVASALALMSGPAHAFNETSIGGMVFVYVAGLVLIAAGGVGLVVLAVRLIIWLVCPASRSPAAPEGVGGPSSFTRQDSIMQGTIVLVCLVLGAAVGLIMGGAIGAGIGAVIGLVASLLVSGTVLMIRGWGRGAERRGD